MTRNKNELIEEIVDEISIQQHKIKAIKANIEDKINELKELLISEHELHFLTVDIKLCEKHSEHNLNIK